MKLSCLATTHKLLHGSIEDSLHAENGLHSDFLANINSEYSYPALQEPKHINDIDSHRYNLPTKVQWLPDGDAFVSITEDLALRTFIPSPTLLEDTNAQLIPFTRSYQHSSIITAELHPSSSLHSGFCGILASSNSNPLKFLNLIPGEDGSAQLVKVFNVQDEQTEAFHKIHSLCFANPSQFLTGSNKMVSLYDINSSSPIMKVKSISGITSSIIISHSEFLTPGSFFIGSFSNKVSLYSPDGTLVSTVALREGNGVIQLLESKNGRYLFVVCRKSKSIHILDIRLDLLPVGTLDLFKSENQRIIGSLMPQSQGLIIGSSNGVINWYKDAELGIPSSTPETVQISESSVNSAQINPEDPSVLLTTIGDRNFNLPEISIHRLFS